MCRCLKFFPPGTDNTPISRTFPRVLRLARGVNPVEGSFFGVSAMNVISSTLRPPDFSPFNPGTSPAASNKETLGKTHFSSAALQVQKSSDITLYTAEGDKVTLSSFSNLEINALTYSSQGRINGEGTRTELKSISLSEQFALNLSVEGDLNEEELKDIQKALKTIEELTTDFFSGKTDKDRANKITALESIARFDAVLQYSKSLSGKQTVTQTAPAPPEPTSSSPFLQTKTAPVEALPLPSVPTQAEAETHPTPGPIQSAVDGGQTAKTAEPAVPPSTQSTPSQQVNPLVEKMMDAVSELKVEPQKIVKQWAAFLDTLFVRLARGERMDLQELKLARQVQNEFSVRMELTLDPRKGARKSHPETGSSELRNQEPLQTSA